MYHAQVRVLNMAGLLQDAARSGMQHTIQRSQPSGLQHVAQLLSGHQTVAAAVLAASMGDVRLASLLAQVSHSLPSPQGHCTVHASQGLLAHHVSNTANIFCPLQPSYPLCCVFWHRRF